MNVTTTGIILTGGRSTRMGEDKAGVKLGNKTLLAHVIDQLGPQVDRLVINSNGDLAGYAQYHLPVIADSLTGQQGPLAGVHAALTKYPTEYLVTVAVDIPHLPADLVARLRACLGTARCAFASNGNHHALALLWAPGSLTLLEEYLATGERSIKKFLADHGAMVLFDRVGDAGLFYNINTREDLARAESALTIS